MNWQELFRNNTTRTAFKLTLSQTMIDFLCAVAGDVEWDRHYYRSSGGYNPYPCNFLLASRYLVDRGLIEDKPKLVILRKHEAKRRKQLERKGIRFTHDTDAYRDAKGGEYSSNYQLTPAGEKVVELFKLAGMFREQIIGKSRKNAT